MTQSRPSSAPAPLVEAAIASLRQLTSLAIKDIAGEELTTLATLCARWDRAIGEELVRRHKERRAGRS